MLLVIHNLPNNIRYFDIKSLIEEKCGSVQVILDNLTSEGKLKCVTVGLADEGDAALLVRKINGLYLNGCQLFVEDIRQKKASEQPYRPAIPTFEPRAEKTLHYENPQPVQPPQQITTVSSMPPMVSVPMAYSNLPFYMSPVQNSFSNYENQVPIPNKQMLQANYQQSASFDYEQPDMQNQWTQPTLTSYPENLHHTSGNIKLVPTNRDTRWGDRSDDERNRSGQSQSERSSRRSPGPNQERLDNRYSKYEMTGRNDSDDRSRRPNRSPPQRRDFSENRSNRRDNDNYQKRQSRFDRSPPKDRPIDDRNRRAREEFRQFDQYEQDKYDSGRSDKRRGDDDREQQRTFDQYDQRGGSDRFDKSRDRDQFTQPREYNQRQTEQTQNFNQYDQSSGCGTHDKNQGYHKANEIPEQKTFKTKYALRNNAQKRPYSNVSQGPNPIYGNDPSISSFNRSNQNVFDKGNNFGGFNRNFAPKQARWEDNSNNGGPKVGVGKPNPTPKPTPTPTQKSESLPFQKLLIRHTGWRHQLAASFAKEIMEKLQPQSNVANGMIYKKLKEGIVSRIDVILGDNIAKSLIEMRLRYRARFNSSDDVNFFHAVMAKIEEEKNNRANKPTGEDNQVNPNGTDAIPNVTEKPREITPSTSGISAPAPTKQTNQVPTLITAPTSINVPTTITIPTPPIFQPNKIPLKKAAPFQAPPTDTQYIIKAPEYGLHTIKSLQRPTYKRKGSKFTSKNEYSEQKKIQRQEHQLENLFDVYTMESPYKEIVEDEINQLVNIFTTRPDKPMDAEEERIFDRMVKEVTPTFRRVMKLNLVKRVLDIRSGLLIRVFPSPKFPKRVALDAFMKNHGVTSFKKSSTMFVAVCDSYKSYDKLIRMGSAVIDDTAITFKAMHVLGPRKSVREKIKDKEKARAARENEQIGRDNDEDFSHGDNIELGDNFDIDDDFENFGDVPEGLNESYDDVVLLENRNNDVVQIEDDDPGKHQSEEAKAFAGEETGDNINELTDNSQQITEANDKVAECEETGENIVQDNQQSEENIQSLEVPAGIEEDDLEDF